VLRINRSSSAGLILAFTFAIACADGATSLDKTPLEGLLRAEATDSAGSSPPRNDTAQVEPGPPCDSCNAAAGPGYFRGVVRGSEIVSGPDTLAGSVRIENVRVSAYPIVQPSPGEPRTGPVAASVITNSKGEFQLPTLSSGEYVVTFVPPEGSKYQGVWVTAWANKHSGDYPWWVTLPMK
jgi:hypothetical protein